MVVIIRMASFTFLDGAQDMGSSNIWSPFDGAPPPDTRVIMTAEESAKMREKTTVMANAGSVEDALACMSDGFARNLPQFLSVYKSFQGRRDELTKEIAERDFANKSLDTDLKAYQHLHLKLFEDRVLDPQRRLELREKGAALEKAVMEAMGCCRVDWENTTDRLKNELDLIQKYMRPSSHVIRTSVEEKVGKDISKTTCPICWTNEVDMVYGCGHVICSTCCKQQGIAKVCHSCRSESGCTRLYFS
jgi:hypothetical protein